MPKSKEEEEREEDEEKEEGEGGGVDWGCLGLCCSIYTSLI